jgi:hypothetical protein
MYQEARWHACEHVALLLRTHAALLLWTEAETQGVIASKINPTRRNDFLLPKRLPRQNDF